MPLFPACLSCPFCLFVAAVSNTIYDTTSEELTDAVLLHVSIVLAAIQLLSFSVELACLIRSERGHIVIRWSWSLDLVPL
jgi:hypothetical protein